MHLVPAPAVRLKDIQGDYRLSKLYLCFSRPRDRVYLHHRRTKDSPVESFLETFAIIFAFHKDNYRHHPRFPLISLVNTRFQSYLAIPSKNTHDGTVHRSVDPALLLISQVSTGKNLPSSNPVSCGHFFTGMPWSLLCSSSLEM